MPHPPTPPRRRLQVWTCESVRKHWIGPASFFQKRPQQTPSRTASANESKGDVGNRRTLDIRDGKRQLLWRSNLIKAQLIAVYCAVNIPYLQKAACVCARVCVCVWPLTRPCANPAQLQSPLEASSYRQQRKGSGGGGVASSGLYTHFCGARFLAKALHAATDARLLCYCSIFFPACQLGFPSDESPGTRGGFLES